MWVLNLVRAFKCLSHQLPAKRSQKSRPTSDCRCLPPWRPWRLTHVLFAPLPLTRFGRLGLPECTNPTADCEQSHGKNSSSSGICDGRMPARAKPNVTCAREKHGLAPRGAGMGAPPFAIFEGWGIGSEPASRRLLPSADASAS
jgi:hypothetical protein